MRSCLPNTIIASWRSSLSQSGNNASTIQPLRSFFTSNSCTSSQKLASQTPSFSSRLFSSASQAAAFRARWTASVPGTPQASGMNSLSSKTAQLVSRSRFFTQQSQQSTRSFSISAIVKAARPNWYKDSSGRRIETVRAGPLKKLQWAIDRRVKKVWLFYGIIAVNIVVFLGWQYARNSATRFRDFGPLQFMFQNFAASWANILRPWTLITSCFSHSDVSHIFVNLFSFWFMGEAALRILSASQFTGLYLIAGLAGNAVQMLWHPLQGNTGMPSFALGASGAISGVLSFYAMAFPHNKIVLFFVLPAPAWLAVGGIIAYDMYLALAHPNGGIAAAAHLGGAGAGILYYLKLVGRRPF